METVSIFVIALSLLGVVILTLLFGVALRRPRRIRWLDRVTEFFFVAVFPCLGIAASGSKCDIHPFDLESLPTAYTITILFSLAYFISRLYKERLSPLLLLFVASLMVGGLLFCVLICLHFSSNVFLLLMPVLNILFATPLFCLLYLIRELIQLNAHLKFKLAELYGGKDLISRFYKWLEPYPFGFIIYLLVPLSAILQALLFLFGQKPDSIISEFTQSCGFLLSYSDQCSCGGDHYLCSVAANGSRRLVKPVRMGWRRNEKIIVNRQLLVANAFENWLEECLPRTHKVIRSTYDACGIPVNRWSKHKCRANIIYMLMKPLEWLFLFWLYLVDSKPEDRIASQYLPKQDINLFKRDRYEKTAC